MLITELKEITALYPNQRWDSREFPQLLAYIEEEEETTLLPILGDSLYTKIISDYETVKDMIVPQTYDTVPADATLTKLRIIRACQRIVFFRMLANNSGIFAVSFNRGGGLNQLSADNYEPADEKTKRTFERDVWNKSKRNIETLLLNLERDSREGKIYTTEWKKSPYFYYHGDLLFTTAEEMKQFYPISDREMYINLIPQIRIIQNSYIIPRLGEKAFNKLIEQKYTSTSSTTTTTTTTTTSTTTTTDTTTLSAEELANLWKKLRTYTLTALAQYLLSRTSNNTHLLADADLALSQAGKLLKDNRYDFFPEERPTTTETTTPTPPPPHRPRCPHHDAILDLGSINYD